jgi:hypothetical protein
MGPQNVKFGGGVAATVLNPFVLLVVLLACAFICFGPRSRALTAFLTAGILIPMDQILVIGGLHFPMLRVLALAGFVRLIRERKPTRTWLYAGGMNRLDLFVILLAVMTAINGVILFRESAALVYQVGNLYSILGIYLLLRLLIRSEEDVVKAVCTLAWIFLLIGGVMAFEHFSGHNPYAMLGGARGQYFAQLAARDDKFRAQGPFGHSILAGTNGAIMAPLFIGLWWRGRKYRKLAIAGVVGSLVMALASNSSTPLLGFVAGVMVLCLWPVRRYMGAVRWGAVALLVVLQLTMKHPVWRLLADIDLTGGSSGWHRYMLIDQCISHFSDWFLIGVKSTASWGWDMWDTADQYVATCDNSGLLAFVLFVGVLVYAFKFMGRVRKASEGNPRTARFAWAMSAALFANAVSFIGISYWDQTQVVWYATLVMVSGMVASQRARKAGSTQASQPSRLQAAKPATPELVGIAS